jgi:hypothetical protein
MFFPRSFLTLPSTIKGHFIDGTFFQFLSKKRLHFTAVITSILILVNLFLFPRFTSWGKVCCRSSHWSHYTIHECLISSRKLCPVDELPKDPPPASDMPIDLIFRTLSRFVTICRALNLASRKKTKVSYISSTVKFGLKTASGQKLQSGSMRSRITVPRIGP